MAIHSDKRKFMQLDRSQMEAVETAEHNKFAIINGGAGTGKTTIIKEIAERAKKRGEMVKLCAFAGKASSRLKEATGMETSTIHSMLGYNSVKFNAGGLQGETVIVDESSMIDSELLSEITKREPERLILVGDQAQLPPVGAGQPFHDIIHYYMNTVHTLSTCYRATEAVFKAAMRIRNGKMPEFHDVSENEVWDIYDTGEAAATEHVLLEWVKQGFFDFDKDIILCPKNGDRNKETKEYPPCTVNGLNEKIVAIVNPHTEGEKFKSGDRIINTKNNPDKDIWNGTTGKVHAVDIDGKLWMQLDIPVIDMDKSTDEKKIYKDKVLLTKDEQKKLQHAYALTVHKSQGSQYEKVCFTALNRDSFSLDRSLVYTAVTRTKKQCVVVGQSSALRRSLQTIKHKETIIQLINGGAER